MNENNKVVIRSTGSFKYTPYPNGIPRDIFPGEYFLLNLNLEQDRLQLANILHPNYRFKGFVMIEQSELAKIDALGYREDINRLIQTIDPEETVIEYFDGSSTYSVPPSVKIPSVGSPDLPRIEYPGVSTETVIEAVKEEKPVVEEVLPETVVEEPVVAKTVEQEEVVVERNVAELREQLESVHYKKLQKIAADKDLNYDTKDQFIGVLLELPEEEFNSIYSEYINS